MNSLNNIDKECLLSVQDLRIYFLKQTRFIRAVDDVSITVTKNQHVGIAGESGSGKTQLALAIMGLTSGLPGIISGQIRYKGESLVDGLKDWCQTFGNPINRVEKNIHGWNKVLQKKMAGVRGRKISMIFQEPRSSLSPYFRIQEQLFEHLRSCFNKCSKSELLDIIFPILEVMNFDNIKKVLNAYPHELSGGECQRVILAMAVATNPELLIADEPTTSLDALTQYQILQLLIKLMGKKISTMIFITHDLALLQHLTDYIIIMFQGKIVEMGSRDQVIGSKNGNHPYTEELLQYAYATNKDINKRATSTILDAHTGRCNYANRCPYYLKIKQKCDIEEQKVFTVGDTGHWIACSYKALK